MPDNGTTAVLEPTDVASAAGSTTPAGMGAKADDDAQRDMLRHAAAYVDRAARPKEPTKPGADYARPAKEEPKAEEGQDAGDEDDAEEPETDEQPQETGSIDVGHIIDLSDETEGEIVGFTRDGKSALVKVEGEKNPRKVPLAELEAGDGQEDADAEDKPKPKAKPAKRSALQTVLDGLGIADEDAEEAEDKLLADFERRATRAEQATRQDRRAPDEDEDEPDEPRTRAGQSRARVRAAAEAIAEGDTDEANLGELTAAELDRVLEGVDDSQRPVLKRLAAMEKRLKKAESAQTSALQDLNARIAWAGLHPILDELGAPGNSEEDLSPEDEAARRAIVHRAFMTNLDRQREGLKPLPKKQVLALSVHAFTKKSTKETPTKPAKKSGPPSDAVDERRSERIQARHRQKSIGPSRPGAGGAAKASDLTPLAAATAYWNSRKG